MTLRHTTLGRTPLEEWSARRRDLCLTTHNTHKRQTSMTLAPRDFFSVLFLPLIDFWTIKSFFMSLIFRTISLYNKRNKNIHVPGGIRTRNPRKRAAVDLTLDGAATGTSQMSIYWSRTQSTPLAITSRLLNYHVVILWRGKLDFHACSSRAAFDCLYSAWGILSTEMA
jgi:hypothetical protein